MITGCHCLLQTSLLALALGVAGCVTGCVTTAPDTPGVLIETAARGQPLTGVACTAVIDGTRWDVVTPAMISLGDARDALRIVCNHPGYRTSELIFRPISTTAAIGLGYGEGLPLYGGSIGARYPKQLTIDMNAL